MEFGETEYGSKGEEEEHGVEEDETRDDEPADICVRDHQYIVHASASRTHQTEP